MKKTNNIGRGLSKAELKKTLGGTIDDGPCTETCGNASKVVECSSPTGKCSRDTSSPSKWIKCDDVEHTCP